MRTILFASVWLAVSTCDDCTAPNTGNGGSGNGGTVYTGEMGDNLSSYAGDYAFDLIRDDDFTSLLVEIDYVAGRAPSQGALDALDDALQTYLDKPDGVSIVVDDEIPAQGAPAWTYETAQDLEITWRDNYRDASTGEAVVYFLYLDGHSDEDDANGRVLGYAYHGSSIVMFKDGLLGTQGPPRVREMVEPTVIVHELGHLLGLVNNGIPMLDPHQDAAHGAHDDNPDCLMYWLVGTDKVSDLIHDGPPVFDAECEADLAAARAN